MEKKEIITTSKLNLLRKVADDVKHIESEIYLNNDKVYKIFHDYEDDLGGYISNKKRKIEMLLEEDPKDNGLIYPNKILLDENNLFMGYSMNLFTPSKNLESLPKEDYLLIIKVIKDICLYLKRLHEENKLIVDFNFNNILYNKEDTRFCDADSMVINNCPAEVIPLLLYRNNSIKIKEAPFEYYKENSIYTKESDVFELNYLLLSLFLREDIIDLDLVSYRTYIKSLNLPLSIQKYLLSIHDMFYKNEELIYPDNQLDELSNYLKRKRH